MTLIAETHPDNRDSVDFLSRYTEINYREGELFAFTFPLESKELCAQFKAKKEPFANEFDFEYFVKGLMRTQTQKGQFLSNFALFSDEEEWPYEEHRQVESTRALIEECRERNSTLPIVNPNVLNRPVNYPISRLQEKEISSNDNRFQAQLESASQFVPESPSYFALRGAVLAMAANETDLGQIPEALELVQFAAAHGDVKAANLLARQ